jgi:hypothetical protein
VAPGTNRQPAARPAKKESTTEYSSYSPEQQSIHQNRRPEKWYGRRKETSQDAAWPEKKNQHGPYMSEL